MADAVKDALLDEATHIKSIVQDVVLSGAYVYPIKGLIYFLTQPKLQQPLRTRLPQTLTLGLGVTGTMFFFTYIPQMTLMAFTSGPLLAPFSAFFLVLSESSTITNYLARSFLLREALLDTFDETLVVKGVQVDDIRHRRRNMGYDRRKEEEEEKEEEQQESRKVWLRSLLYLPLNFIPVVGTFIYVYVQGKRVGPLLHKRYFELKGWGSKKKKRDEELWVQRFRGAYTGFGVASFLLEMIPFASIGFAFTNTVGAALWAADLEKAMQ